jgi:hypothetical protein
MAQYLLQLTRGPGYSGSVSLACSGAPLGATCHVPSSVSVANSAPSPFTVTVATSGGASLPPSIPIRFTPVSGQRVLPLLALGLVLLMAVKNLRRVESAEGRRGFARYSTLTAAIFCVFLGIAGCEEGSAAVPQQSIVTPAGTSTIVITPAAMSSSGQPLELQPIPLKLIVK